MQSTGLPLCFRIALTDVWRHLSSECGFCIYRQMARPEEGREKAGVNSRVKLGCG